MKQPKIVTVADVIDGCICAVENIAGDEVVLRNVCCPLHGDQEIIEEIRRSNNEETDSRNI